MPHDDRYAQYRTALTEAESAYMGDAEASAARMDADPDLEKVPGGYKDKDGSVTPHPVIAEHMGIAMQRAEAQFKGWPAMPEDEETPLRFPGIDPVGHYSIIDMRFDQRMAQVKATLESRAPEVQTYVQGLIDAAKRGGEVRVFDTAFRMMESAKKHRTLTRASKLCLDPEGRRMLHQQSRDMESDLAVTQYDKYLQGIEYAAGVKTGPVPEDVTTFYAEHLEHPLDLGIVARARSVDKVPAELHVEFQDLDHKLLQLQFADPKNWGKKPPEAGKETVSLQQAADAIEPYAQATAARTLDPLFSGVEDSSFSVINRGDLIIVDGKTIREQMYERYVEKEKSPEGFDDYYQQNYRSMSNRYVAAALMAGKRVETFIPDKDGRIPAEPTQLTKTGYEPSPLKKVTLNAWERFFSKFGLYKTKTAKAAEYQRFVDARQRVQAASLFAQLEMDAGVSLFTKSQFFGGWMAENGALPDEMPNRYSVTRSALSTFAACALAAKGHSIEEIHDPTLLRPEKDAVGREVIARLQAGDQKWAGETLFHGQRKLLADIDRLTTGMDLGDESAVFKSENRALFHAAQIVFDASQEEGHCRPEVDAAAERFAPGHGPEVYNTVTNGVNSVGSYFDAARKSLHGRVNLASGMASDSDAVGHLVDIVTFQAARQCYGEQRSAHPELAMSKYFDLNSFLAYHVYVPRVEATPAYHALSAKLDDDPAFRVTMGKELLTGRFQKRMEIKTSSDMLNGTFDFGVRALSEEEVKQAQRDDQIQKTDQKNAAKAAAHKPQGPTPRTR